MFSILLLFRLTDWIFGWLLWLADQVGQSLNQIPNQLNCHIQCQSTYVNNVLFFFFGFENYNDKLGVMSDREIWFRFGFRFSFKFIYKQFNALGREQMIYVKQNSWLIVSIRRKATEFNDKWTDCTFTWDYSDIYSILSRLLSVRALLFSAPKIASSRIKILVNVTHIVAQTQ